MPRPNKELLKRVMAKAQKYRKSGVKNPLKKAWSEVKH
jgi:hypothetical protein